MGLPPIPPRAHVGQDSDGDDDNTDLLKTASSLGLSPRQSVAAGDDDFADYALEDEDEFNEECEECFPPTRTEDGRRDRRETSECSTSSSLSANYDLLQTVGQGAFGKVRQARRLRDNQNVAVKTIETMW